MWSKLSVFLLLLSCSLGKQAPKPHDDHYSVEKEGSPSPVELITWGKGTLVHRGRKDIYLANYAPHNAVALLLVNEVSWNNGDLKNMSGHVQLHAPPGHGIIAVVQAINLRTTSSIDECLDHIQFYDPLNAIGSLKICGRLTKENRRFLPEGVVGGRVFDSSSGMLQLEYRSARGGPEFSSKKSSALNFHMVEIVFTAYKDCAKDPTDDERSPCGTSCISSLVFCDERINCGDEDDFAIDERACIPTQDDRGWGDSPLIHFYIAGLLLFLILGLITFYHQRQAYRRIKNIPH